MLRFEERAANNQLLNFHATQLEQTYYDDEYKLLNEMTELLIFFNNIDQDMKTRNKLSALLMDTSEDNPMDVDIILDTEEAFGLSTLQMPHVIKVFQDPKEGIMYMLLEGAEDYIEIDEDDEETIKQIYDYLWTTN